MRKSRILKDVPETPKSFSKKDRKKWCGGKAGLEHDGVWTPAEDVYCPPNTPQAVQMKAERSARVAAAEAAGIRIWKCNLEYLVCRRCGKHMKIREHKEV